VVIGLAFASGILIAWALGARLSLLSDLRLHGDALVFASLAIQLLIFTPLAPHVRESWVVPLHLASYCLLVAFVLVNVRVPGFWLVGVGVVSNLFAIAANHGRMPVSAANWRAAGGDHSFLVSGVSENNILAGGSAHLTWLGDVFVLPRAIPFAAAISIGDILIVLGAIGFVYRACAPPVDGASVGFLTPLRSAAFRRIISGRLVSGVGDWLSQAALVTWIYLETHSTLLVSVFLVARIVAAMVGAISSAPLLDRVGGFRTLGLVEASRGALTAAMIPLGIAGLIMPIIALSTISSFLSAATTPSAAGLLPDLLEDNELQAGNALHNLAPSLTSIIGATLGAVLVVHWGIGTTLAIDVATFLVAALMYQSFAGRLPDEPRSPDSAVSRRALLTVIAKNRVLLGVASAFACSTAAFGMLNASTSVFFDQRFDSPEAYGYVAAMIGVGYLVGEALTGRVRQPVVVRRSISVALLITAGATFLIAGSPTLTTAFLAMFVLGAADGVTEVAHDTLIQRHTPRRMLAGAFAMISSIERAGMIAGVLAAPLVVSATSPQTAVHVAGALMLCGAAIAGVCLIRPFPPAVRRPPSPVADHDVEVRVLHLADDEHTYQSDNLFHASD
jgi:MFS family permease